ncbi:MAG: putative Ig domain-containing protein [bacterium]
MQNSKIKIQKLLLIPLIIFAGIVFFVNSGKDVMAEVLTFTQPSGTLNGTEYVGVLPPGQAGQAYSFPFVATGGTGSYTWALRSLRTGFSLDSNGVLRVDANNAIAGQTYTVRVYVTSGSGENNWRSGTFTLQFISTAAPTAGQPPRITPKALPDGIAGQSYPSQTIEVMGGTPPYSFRLQVGDSLPGGLSLSPIHPSKANNGIISGTPITAETKTFQLKATDNANIPSEPVSFSIRVNSPAPGTDGIPAPGSAIPAPGSTGGVNRICPVSIQSPNLYAGYQDSNKNNRFDQGEPQKTAGYDGLVPCGKCVVAKNITLEAAQTEIKNNQGAFSGNGQYVSCQFCHFFVMFGGMVNFLIWKIAIPAAILLLVIGGAMFVFAAGNPGMIKKGMDIMKSVAIGLVIMFVAWIVVSTILTFIGVADWTGLRQGWFGINCPIKI